LPADDVQPQTSTLSDYIDVVRRRKWVVIVSTILVPLAAYALAMQQQKLFQSSAQVYISRQDPSANLTHQSDPSLFEPADRFMQTQVDLARAEAIAAQVADSAHVRGLTAARLLGSSTVTELTNSDILLFTVKNASPALSKRLVSEYANAFTVYRRQLDIAVLQSAQKQVQARIAHMAKQGQTSGTLYNNLASINVQLATMIALGTSSTHVIQEPTGSAQVQPKPMTDAIIGLALGLIIGLSLAFLLEALDNRARNADDISERLGGLPLLVRLPRPERKLRSKGQLAMVAAPNAPEAEAFRVLRIQLDLARLEHPTKTIMVTSAVAKEGKSTTTANLALALARAGRRVVLVDLDLYHPNIGEFFSLDGPGVTDVLLGTADLNDALVPIRIDSPLDGPGDASSPSNGNGAAHRTEGSLEVLPAGPIPTGSGDLMNAQALQEVLRRLEERSDTVLIDTSPLLQAGDALTLSTKVDGLLLVVRQNVVRQGMLRDLARVLDRTPVTKLGFVLTDVAVEPGYGYGYRRAYQPGEKGSARQVAP
jgi:Mrp family chromosome partitioning ATPase/capsular polysaccharide biosynthesis protein